MWLAALILDSGPSIWDRTQQRHMPRLHVTILGRNRSLRPLYAVSAGNAFGHRQVPVESRPRNTQHPTDLVDAQTAVLVQALRGYHPRIVGTDWLAAAEATPCPGSRKACLGTFLNQPPLELSQTREDVNSTERCPVFGTIRCPIFCTLKKLQPGWLPRSSLALLLLHRDTEHPRLAPGLEPVALALDVDGRRVV